MKTLCKNIVPFILFFALGCQEKPPLLEALPLTGIDTAYVLITPSFGGFNGAEDITIGNDQLLYVADTRNNRIVMMNRAGQVMSERTMLEPLSVAQDSRLDLLVGGLVETPGGLRVGAVFRIHLVDAAHRLESARIDTIWRELAKPARRFPGITVFGDNSYLVVRNGPDNASFVDPDARVLNFSKSDVFISPVAGLTTRAGSGITDIFRPTAIASFPSVKDFVITQVGDQVAYGAIWLRYENSPEFEGWLPRYDPANVDDRGRDFIRPNRFNRPEAVVIDPVRRDIFIADAGLDSVFKFNNRGAFRTESFGRIKTDGLMRKPTGLAFFERMLYVMDSDSTRNQILRFRLTTDIQR